MNDQDIRKSDKKDVLDLRQKLQINVDDKMDKAEGVAMVTDFTKEIQNK